ncbi:hypothetical protein K457DRAFT_15844 [Linnemannia elongata AG-77]|uniref:Secreted protein n=1 Tax=Linnemannia elongata AG-77 TaxID=1314771 RepID=A0A197K7U2_9FUNG|nr:hypothetical protein K457DRAFT_15844 [Linnemannia elongata AG-77]
MLFLLLFSSLRYFVLSDDSITFEELVDSDSSNNRNINKQKSNSRGSWKCTTVHSTLGSRRSTTDPKAQFGISDALFQVQYALFWKHLGRFGKLCSLHLD